MPTFEVIVQIKKDGVDLAGFPFRRVITTAEGSDFNVVKAAGDVTPQPFPGLIAGSALQFFVASTDQPVDLIPGAVVAGDGIISLQGGGLVLIFQSDEDAPTGDQIQIENSGTQPANLKGAWASS